MDTTPGDISPQNELSPKNVAPASPGKLDFLAAGLMLGGLIAILWLGLLSAFLSGSWSISSSSSVLGGSASSASSGASGGIVLALVIAVLVIGGLQPPSSASSRIYRAGRTISAR